MYLFEIRETITMCILRLGIGKRLLVMLGKEEVFGKESHDGGKGREGKGSEEVTQE